MIVPWANKGDKTAGQAVDYMKFSSCTIQYIHFATMDPAPNRGLCSEPAVGVFSCVHCGGCVTGTEQVFADSQLAMLHHS